MLSQRPGEAVQVDPIKTCVEIAYIFLRVKLSFDEPLSNFAFEFNLRRYSLVVSLNRFNMLSTMSISLIPGRTSHLAHF